MRKLKGVGSRRVSRILPTKVHCVVNIAMSISTLRAIQKTRVAGTTVQSDPSLFWWRNSSEDLGIKIVDLASDTWDDWLDKNDGPKEDFKDEYPKGFMWTCCGRPGDEVDGCKNGKHKAEGRKSKRAKGIDKGTELVWVLVSLRTAVKFSFAN